jgi:hypothetical protein
MVAVPSFFDSARFNEIPHARGIYGFYLDLRYLERTLESPAPPRSAVVLLQKALRAHTIGTPEGTNINLYGRSAAFHSLLRLTPSHLLGVDKSIDDAAAPLLMLARGLSKCTLFSPPLYVGITIDQTFATRFEQHRQKYNRLKANRPSVTIGDMFAPGGTFPDKLVRRQIEFRDLLFACVALEDDELQHARTIEKLLHMIANPSLSEAH